MKSVSFWRRLAMVVLVVAILVRPTFSNSSIKKEYSNLNIWFAVDATGSMIGKDIEGGTKRRYEKVREDIGYIVAEMPGARFGLVVQDFDTYLASPISTDTEAISAASAYVVPKYSSSTSPTNISELVDTSIKQIKNYKTKHSDRSNVLIVMSDGEDVSGTKVAGSYDTAPLDMAFVFGYGTEKGVNLERITSDFETGGIKINEDSFIYYSGKNENVTTNTYGEVISKINQANLSTIASGLNAEYYHRESGNVPEAIIEQMTNIKTTAADDLDQSVSVAGELYWLFAILLFGLLLWECEDVLTKILLERRTKNG